MLNPKQEAALAAVLAGKTYKEAAEDAGFTEGHVKQLFRPGSRWPEVYEEYQRRLQEQSETLSEEADRSKDALISELEEVAEYCREGRPILSKEREIIGHERDHANWIRTIVERGKLLGYYVDKKEINGKLTVADIISSIDLEEDE